MSGDLDGKFQRILDDLAFLKGRLTVPIGTGTALTYLADETPIYVNQNDFGCASNLINGGLYEEDNFWVLLSFLRPDTVFLDIGANVGVFSVRLAPRIKSGQVYSFEPNPGVCGLLKQSAFMNGLSEKIDAREIALSDTNGEARLFVPAHSAGDGSFHGSPENAAQEWVCQTRRLDDLMPADFTCDLVKLDVENHELAVLDGMREIVGRSASKVKVLLEKIGTSVGSEEGLYRFWNDFGISLYHVEYPSSLTLVDLSEFKARSGYFLAARPESIGDRLRRSFLNIYPQQLNVLLPHRYRNSGAVSIQGNAAPETVIFHGPYWYLPKGSYQLRIVGVCKSALQIAITERFGYPVASFRYTGAKDAINFNIPHDLIRFEIGARAAATGVDLELERIELERLG